MDRKTAEKAVIGNLIQGFKSEIYLHQIGDFKAFSHIFKAIKELNEKGELFTDGELNSRTLVGAAGISFSELSTLISCGEASMYVPAFGVLLEERQKEAVNAFQSGKIRADELAAEITQIEARKAGTGDSYKDAAMCFYEELDEKTKDNFNDLKLDYCSEMRKLLPELKRGEMLTVAARPGVGKSATAVQIAAHALKQNKKVMYVTLEMPRSEIIQRYITLTKGLEYEKMDKPKEMTADEWGLISVTIDELADRLIVIDKTHFISQIRAAVLKHRPDVLIVDQMTLIKSPDKRLDARLTMSAAAEGLHNLATDMYMPVIALTQLRRSTVQGPPPEPDSRDLKESSGIEEASDIVMLLHKVDRTQMQHYPPFKNADYDNMIRDGYEPICAKITKRRHGKKHKGCMLYKGDRYRFIDTFIDL